MAEWHDQEGRRDDPAPAEFAKWLAPEECFRHLNDGVPDQGLVNRLLKRLGDGKLVAAATEARWKAHDHQDGGVRYAPTTIDPRWWLNARDAQNSYSDLWRTGEFSCLIEYDPTGRYNEEVLVNFYGVRFEFGEMLNTVPGLKEHNPRIPKVGGGYFAPGDPIYDKVELERRRARDDPPEASKALRYSDLMRDPEVAKLQEEVAALRAARQAPSPGLVDLDTLPPPRGRPPAAFWEDLILEIAQRMHLGDFKPQTQVEVEDAMDRWIRDRGYKGGRETQIKERARKVFKLFKD